MAQSAHGPSDSASKAAKAVADAGAEALDRIDLKADPATIAGDAKDAAKSAAKDLKSAAVAQGRQLLEAAKDEATSFADQRKNDAADSVSGIASSLRETGRTFEDRPNIKTLVESAADGLEQLAGGLRERSFADIYSDVEAYARRSPATVGAVAVVAGFVLARFIKSSSDDLSEAASDAARTRARTAAVRRGRSAAEA